MALYRADPKDGVAWITGASTGIGRQLGLDLAREGYVVAATARHQEDLDTLAQDASGASGRVVPFLCDVTDESRMEATVARIERELGPIVLAVFNAGTYSPTHGERLETHNFVATFNINVLGVIYGLVPVADRMRDRGFGQIAVVGSVTSYFGLPSAAAYGGTKAAINSIAQSLRYDFEKLNIRIQVVNPGFVATPLTAKNRFKMPALMKVEDAAQRMASAFRTGGFETTFPRRLTWPMKLLRMLPQDVIHRVIRRATGWDQRQYGIKREDRKRK
jgi:NAD(P)-dependent dehydrogenase (short-subunit alcohol dehydrogenase family)